MMIFSFLNYKEYIRSKINEQKQSRGYQQILAEHAGCQKSFFSQMLNSDKIHLSAEQGMALADYWHLSSEETSFWLDLISYQRAGSKKLQQYLERKIQSAKKSNNEVTNKFHRPSISHDHRDTMYYSSWLWAAVHVATSSEYLQTADSIAKHLKVSKAIVEEILISLNEMGLVKKKSSEKWQFNDSNIHLPPASPLTSLNHANWRGVALSKIMQPREDNLHFSSVFTISKKDFFSLKEQITHLLVSAKNIVAETENPADLMSLNIDYFYLNG